MDNKVFINEKHQIEIIFGEKIVEEELKTMLEHATVFILKNKKNNLPVNLLVSVNDLKNLTIGARRLGSAWILKQPISKISVYGNNLFMKYFIPMLIGGLGLKNKMRFFDTKNEAENWLD